MKTGKVKEFLNKVTEYTNVEPDGACIVVFYNINGIEYVFYSPDSYPFVDKKQIETINGKEYIKSSYLLPILKKRFKILFELPDNGRD